MDYHQQLQEEFPDVNMALFEHELRWAHKIKEAIAANDTLRPICDLEVAQFAICTVADPFGINPAQTTTTSLKEVLERVYRLQCFRDYYKLDHDQDHPLTVEDRCQLLRAYVKQQQPGHLVTIDYLPSKGHYMIVWDRAAFHPARVAQEADWRIYQGATYTIFMVLNSNLRAVRSGVEVILECDGMSVHNYDSAFEERRVNELFNYYPFINKEFHFLNTPTVAIFLYQVVKPFLNKDFQRTVKLDAKLEGFEGHRIDTLYNVPTFENAQDRLLQRLEGYLRERLHHQRTYQLPPKPNGANDNTTMPIPGILGHADGEVEDDELDDERSESDMSMVGDY